jgi:hypothetical protein
MINKAQRILKAKIKKEHLSQHGGIQEAEAEGWQVQHQPGL